VGRACREGDGVIENKNNGLLFKVLLATHKFISAKVTLTYSSDTANQPKNSLLRIQPLD
jgi:hypothetical protein